MKPIVTHGLTLYTASDELTETEPDVEECTQRMDVPRSSVSWVDFTEPPSSVIRSRRAT